MNEDGRQDPLIGRTVADGRYEVVALLGVGGMGTVYRALQHPLERQVALKLIHRELAMNASIVARFEREMRLTASIEHPHTVRVYDVGDIDGQPFLAMEYLAGRSLRAVLDTGGAMPVDRLAAIGLQMAKALRAAHQAGIVHRDLKPDNVLLVDGYGERDFVKVLDFGIARPLEQEVGFQTVAGAIVGTPAYMSPEQATGASIDTRSDLYSLGVMLFEMATGVPPFAGRSMTALLIAHASEGPPSLEGYRSIPEEVRTLIAALLQKDPMARPASADAIIDVLVPFAATEMAGAAGQDTAGAPRGTGGARPSGPPHATGAPSGGGGSLRPPSAVGGGTALPIGGTLALPETEGPGRRTGPGTRGGGPAPVGTRILPTGDEDATDHAPDGRGRGAHPIGSRRRSWPVVMFGVVAVVVAGGLAYRRWGGGPLTPDRRVDGAARGSDSSSPVDGAAPPGDAEPIDPAVAGRLAPLLQAAGEPPWPAACRGREAAVLRRLADAARALGGAAGDGKGDGDLGRATALEAIRALPDSSAERWIVEARATLATDTETAVRAGAKAIELCPSSPVAHNLLGNALQRAQRFEPSADEYRAAIHLAPAFLAPRFNLGLVQLRREDAAGALATFDAIARADADYPNLPLVRAEAHRRLGDAAAATNDLRDQVKRHPKVADGWLQLGRALTATRDKRGAQAAFCRAKALGSAAAAALCRR